MQLTYPGLPGKNCRNINHFVNSCIIPNMSDICPKCGNVVASDYAFCPSCGYKNSQIPQHLSTFEIAKIFLGSIFLSPLSLYWFFKYYKKTETKKIAYISLAITLITLLIGILTAIFYISAVSDFYSVM